MDAFVSLPLPGAARVQFQRRLLAAVLWVNIILVALVVVSLQESRKQYDERATIAASNLTQLLERDITASLDQTDLALQVIVQEVLEQIAERQKPPRRDSRDLQQLLDTKRVSHLLQHYIERQPYLNDLRIANADGLIVFGDQPHSGPPVSIRDREYFVLNRDGNVAGPVISAPLVSRVHGDWIITISRRIQAEKQGPFLGVVYAAIPVTYFYNSFSRLNLGKYGAATLRWQDMSLVARFPAFKQPGGAIGNRYVSSQLLERLKVAPAAGVYTAPTGLDRIERRNAYRHFERYPFYVLVGLATEDYTEGWWHELYKMLALLALFVGVSVLLARILNREWREREAHVQQLLQMERKFRTLLNFAPEGMVITDPQGIVLMCNRQVCSMLGCDRDEIVGKPVCTFLSIAQQGDCKCCEGASFAHCLQETLDQAGLDLWLQDRFGLRIPVMARISPIETEQGPMLALSISDITERRQLEDTLRARQDDLMFALRETEAAKAEAEKANRAKSQFLSNISHELRTPMHSILSFAQLGSKRSEQAERSKLQHYFDTIDGSAKRLLAFVNDLIHLADLQAGRIPLNLQATNLHALWQQIQPEFAGPIADKRLQLQIDVPEALPPVLCDPQLVLLVLQNLLANAIRFSPDAATIRFVLATAEAGELCASLADQGPGIPDAELEAVFDPFVQSGKARSGMAGTGLGLSICREIIKLHRGKLWAENTAGSSTDTGQANPGGAVLRFCLPLLPVVPLPATENTGNLDDLANSPASAELDT